VSSMFEAMSKTLKTAMRLIGASRHSALPLVRERVQPVMHSAARQALALLVGSALIGAAVGFLVQADLGLAPYDVLSSGLEQRLGISLGQAGWIVAAVLFVVSSALGHRPSVWGIGYIVANGVAVDTTAWLLNSPNSTPARVGFVVAGIVIMSAGVNVVLYSGTTGGPFELLMLAGEDRGINRMHTRYFLDVAVLVLGIVLGGAFGVATIVYAALMGVILQVTRQVFLDYDAGKQLRLAQDRTSP